jgi:S-methylmethionine-dependent homocysteine/selenocysteine methylase
VTTPGDVPVVMLCGGMGTRLRETSENLPKPPVGIGRKPILWDVTKTHLHHGYLRVGGASAGWVATARTGRPSLPT